MNEPSVTAPDSTLVVVMDDSRSARFALGKFLEAMGCQVSSVADLPALMAALDAQPAAMLIVEHDPADVGFERLRQVKSHPNAASVPVVLSLSDALPGFDAQAFAQGAAAVMVKPPSRDSIAALIDGLLGGARTAPVIVSPPAATARAEQLTQQMAEQAADIRAGIASLVTPAPASTLLDTANDNDTTESAPAQPPAAAYERPIAEQLRALESRLNALERSVENELMELRVQLDLSLQAQSDRIDQSRDMLQAMVIEQAQAVAERTVMNAASRISDRLAESILKTINRNATSGHDPSTTS